jgi:hypothetical protein
MEGVACFLPNLKYLFYNCHLFVKTLVIAALKRAMKLQKIAKRITAPVLNMTRSMIKITLTNQAVKQQAVDGQPLALGKRVAEH